MPLFTIFFKEHESNFLKDVFQKDSEGHNRGRNHDSTNEDKNSI